MTLTKQDIDALVGGMCPRVDYLVEIAGSSLFSGDVRRAMYKAAGLTATGERKPERVRCWMHEWADDGRRTITTAWPRPVPTGIRRTIPGTFVPDGAE